MNKAYLLLGSNIGNREKYLSDARALLTAGNGQEIAHSSIYTTQPWPAPRPDDTSTEQNDFLNQVILIETPLSAQELLSFILNTEEKLGRKRNVKWEARTIDIDILFFNNDIIKTDSLTVPHPFIQDRRFVLTPLAEIAANYIHPIFQKTVKIMLKENTDTLKVNVFQS